MRSYIIFILLFSFTITSCSKSTGIKEGDLVLINLKLTNSQNIVIDETGYKNKEMSLLIKVGNSEVFKPIDNGLIGMKRNEEKKILLPPNKAYGCRGVFYLGQNADSIYVVKPTDTLIANIKILNVY